MEAAGEILSLCDFTLGTDLIWSSRTEAVLKCTTVRGGGGVGGRGGALGRDPCRLSCGRLPSVTPAKDNMAAAVTYLPLLFGSILPLLCDHGTAVETLLSRVKQ